MPPSATRKLCPGSTISHSKTLVTASYTEVPQGTSTIRSFPPAPVQLFGPPRSPFCALNKWTKENPDFQNNEYKQNYYTHTLVAIANNKEHNEEKIIKKLCNNSYIKEE